MTEVPAEYGNNREFFDIYHYLCEPGRGAEMSEYSVPSLLVSGEASAQPVNVGNPYRFFAAVFERISRVREEAVPGGSLSTSDVVYQSYIRTFASLNGEIGTALKQIAFLPFLKEGLGVTVFISLPSGVIGETNRKGRRGSPFAIKNPFCVDASLGDRLLPNFSATSQYKALVQACCMLGIRFGSIVPLTVLAMDSPLFKAFPDLGYWWLAHPGEMLFAKSSEWDQPGPGGSLPRRTIHIDNSHKTRFVEPPRAEEVRVIEANGHSYYVADVGCGGKRQMVTLANAFPDPVAGDPNCYTWEDVAAVRYTRDAYPPPQGSLIKPEVDKSRSAWLIMPVLIAWRAHSLGEDYFLLDVNENVPQEILRRASHIVAHWSGEYQTLAERLLSGRISLDELREVYGELDGPPDGGGQPAPRRRIAFLAEEFWDFELENSHVSAITGPLINCVSAHSHNHDLLVNSLRHHLRLLESSASPKFYFGGVSNHDTMPPHPRAVPLLYTMYHFLPRSVPMIFSGSEYYASVITNKEFGFSTPELAALREKLGDEDLALFNDIPVDWAALPDEKNRTPALIPLLQALRRTRRLLFSLAPDDLLGYRFWDVPGAPMCFGYARERRGAPEDFIVVLANWDRRMPSSVNWRVPASALIGVVATGHRRPHSTAGATLVLEPLSVAVIGSGVFRNLPAFEFHAIESGPTAQL